MGMPKNDEYIRTLDGIEWVYKVPLLNGSKNHADKNLNRGFKWPTITHFVVVVTDNTTGKPNLSKFKIRHKPNYNKHATTEIKICNKFGMSSTRTHIPTHRHTHTLSSPDLRVLLRPLPAQNHLVPLHFVDFGLQPRGSTKKLEPIHFY